MRRRRLCPGANIAYPPRYPIRKFYKSGVFSAAIPLKLAIATNGNQPWKLLRKCSHQGAIEKRSIRVKRVRGGGGGGGWEVGSPEKANHRIRCNPI